MKISKALKNKIIFTYIVPETNEEKIIEVSNIEEYWNAVIKLLKLGCFFSSKCEVIHNTQPLNTIEKKNLKPWVKDKFYK